MNKYQKEKSREIRDIMRSDNFGRMAYKEAKRRWRKGIRAFKVGNEWVGVDIAHLGFSRKQIMEAGRAYLKVLEYCTKRNLKLDCYYDHHTDAYILRFHGRSVDRKAYYVGHAVSALNLRYYRGSLMDITERVLDDVNSRLQEFIFPSVIKSSSMNMRLDLDRRMLFSDHEIMSREEVLAKISVKEDL